MSKPVICLLCGGQSTEHEVSLMSAKNVVAAIPADKYEVLIVGIAKDGSWKRYQDRQFLKNGENPEAICLADGGTPVFPMRLDGKCVLASLGHGKEPIGFDLIFPVLHGRNGEDGSVQGLAQLLGCPCVGCPMTASAICMDKGATKQILEYEGIHTAPWMTLYSWNAIPDPDTVISRLGLPLFVKPANA